MTYNIGTSTSTATINQEGSIFSFKCENYSVHSPAYLVFFNEYSRVNPFCELWDISGGIENIKQRNILAVDLCRDYFL